MVKRLIAFWIVFAVAVLFCAPNLQSQPVEIGEGDVIHSLWSWKTVPIQKHLDTLYVILDQYSPGCFLGVPPQGWGDWGEWYGVPVDGDHLEFVLAKSGDHFYYDSESHELLIWEYDYHSEYWIYRDCPGRPVLDSEDNIHLIWNGGSDTLFYAFSSDTLNTYDVIDTLLNFPQFTRFVSSPDKNYVGAVFFDPEIDSVYKFTAYSGEAMDFSVPDGIFECDFDSYYGGESPAYDMILDNQGRLYSIINRNTYSWGEDHIWTEPYGFRYICESNDVVMMQISYQIVFGQNEGEILVISSENFIYANHSRFYITLDGGDIWYESGFEADGASGSSTRQYSDSLDFVYSEGDYSYYYRIPRDSILNEMTSIPKDEQEFPRSFSLSNYPNPFNSSTTISFSLPEGGQVKLDIYDITGRLVRTLVDGEMSAGMSNVKWHGTDSAGQIVASGIYFYSLRFEDKEVANRMLFLK